MLRKLIKHDLIATGRYLLPLYGIMLVLSLVNRILSAIDIYAGYFEIIKILMMFAYGISVVASIIVTFVFMILRFYKNLLTDEGYLMFTLPAKPSQLINSKLLVSLLWNIMSIIVVICSLLILFLTSKRIDLIHSTLDNIFTSLKSEFGTNRTTLIMIELILLVIISIIQQTLLIYVSIAIGHLVNGHKVLASFVAYFAINTILQTVMTAILLIGGYVTDVADININIIDLPQYAIAFSLIVSSIFSTLYYLITNYIFNKKLNLE
ncbi:hypothetical protein [Herbinix luporum]|jgi:hypothetical protein|uniref:Putative membrane protein n=1 Tax=Herbinix luporum TaxID=1679721 RepID=A0A0K8J6U4_9FIRM|nr:hypothetical protein [Herbinix luporum]MDI9489636.1 hypothetical protein [Bacillota bacterium]CUH93210.1 putative membrane protein [Herbinix luporum]HHT57937.1 hypothetical protein [Herbinix luporum]